RPPTSICEPWPKVMPLGLIRNTRPLELKVPRMSEGSPPVTRLSTALCVFCWMNLVISSRPMENAPQLMTAPGVLVTVRVLPEELKVAVPETTLPPPGFAWVTPAKHDETASAKSLWGQ